MSTATALQDLPGFALEAADADLFEAVALRTTCAAAMGWPSQPGSAQDADDDGARTLHYAPGRWLVAGAAARAPRVVAAAAAGECTLTDVTGKWQALRASGAPALHRLGSGANLESLLSGRECAAATLFDCPVILVRRDEGCLVWLRRSYVEAFLTVLRGLRVD